MERDAVTDVNVQDLDRKLRRLRRRQLLSVCCEQMAEFGAQQPF